MNDTHLQQARSLVRQAAEQLTEDDQALTAASADALVVGRAARVDDLRLAVLAAWSAGASREELARDAGVKMGLIGDWIAANDLSQALARPGHRHPS
ncbi:hypothetical protein [Actinacidiphila oryziradicis]|jgi:hypothetical protein|uniref:Uncharacterized protein n=1 Tax=Actinacidiphila oryziradicis TaxID=2571141 RepID=A0A4U0RM29_9ACTN|nr:hypothetical protein [Actinacidiphila oryziradicis]MCW2869139.1 hypothetical protein [Actinacidiphila oryziradicis]TJZ95840.1 hypothetical protein FCI23_51810 [Actinacidiphila oryziradicis]